MDRLDSISQPFIMNKDSSCLEITILLVDDDCTTLSIVSSMLNTCKFSEFCFVEIKVTTVEKPSAALSALRTHRAFDLVITDLHMPEIDGIQLKEQIDREFKLPVIVMSADTNKNAIQRSLACGAVQFMKKPLKADDLKNIWKHAMAAKKAKSVLLEDDCIVRNDIKPVPVKTIQSHDDNNNTYANSSSSSSTVNTGNEVQKTKNGNSNGSCSSKKDRKRKTQSKISEEDDDDINDLSRRAPKRSKVVWTNSLHNLFLQAIRHIGLERAVPKKILGFMNVPGLTRENVASHLQKYRIFLKKVAERGVISAALMSNRALTSNFAFGHFNNPPRRSFGSSNHGFGLSKMLNTSLPRRQSVFDNPTLYASTQPTRPSYGIGGSNLYGTSFLSHKGANFGFQTPKESQRSNLFNQSNLISGTHGSGYCSSGITKNYNSYLNSSSSNYGTNYAGIRINSNGELFGIGSTRINGDGRNSSTAALGGNMNHGFNHLSAQAGSSSNPSGFQPISNNFHLKNDYGMDDLAAIVGDNVFPNSEFDELNLTSLDCLPYDPSNLAFNFNQNAETVLDYVPMDTSNDNGAPNVEMNRLVDAVPNEVNLSADQEMNNQFMESSYDPGWSEDDFMKAFFEDGVL